MLAIYCRRVEKLNRRHVAGGGYQLPRMRLWPSAALHNTTVKRRHGYTDVGIYLPIRLICGFNVSPSWNIVSRILMHYTCAGAKHTYIIYSIKYKAYICVCTMRFYAAKDRIHGFFKKKSYFLRFFCPFVGRGERGQILINLRTGNQRTPRETVFFFILPFMEEY